LQRSGTFYFALTVWEIHPRQGTYLGGAGADFVEPIESQRARAHWGKPSRVKGLSPAASPGGNFAGILFYTSIALDTVTSGLRGSLNDSPDIPHIMLDTRA